MTPNLLAYAALAAWPLMVLCLYAVPRNRLAIARITAWMVILPVMFLPSSLTIKIGEGIPGLDKHRIAFLAIAIALALFHGRELWRHVRLFRFPIILLPVIFYAIVRTVQTNGDTLVFGAHAHDYGQESVVVGGLTTHDIWSIATVWLLDIYLPFAVGQLVFRTERDLHDLFEVLSLCAIIYVPFCLVELRLSPQFHRWVYGYHPHEFIQSIRGGSYRPFVFMRHGLDLARFFLTCFCAALAVRKLHSTTTPVPAGWRTVISGAIVALCKTFTAIVYCLFALVFSRLLSARWIRVAVIATGVIVLSYPSMRMWNLFPAKKLVEIAARVDRERAESLQFRFENEDRLLERAMQRPVFGWGTFGRERVYTDWGKDISVQDGSWIIYLGEFGYAGFCAFFVWFLVPLARLAWNFRSLTPRAQTLAGMLAVVVALLTLDLLPNSLADRLPLVYAGALLTLSGVDSRAAALRRTVREKARERSSVRARTVARTADVGQSEHA